MQGYPPFSRSPALAEEGRTTQDQGTKFNPDRGAGNDLFDSSCQISQVVGTIHRQLGAQGEEVQHITGEIDRARQQLGDLKRSVSEIDAITETVKTITDQTKILSINATIEAMKAGEKGLGFAVVADEVKKFP